ncbi:putative WD40 repeat-containing protein [Verrucomicrobia bacterium]|nr:putative WD40 repeat-containing protein [Verrucomicrobiota bacterium]
MWLAEACGEDVALRERVEALLRAHETAGSFMECPALGPLENLAGLSVADQCGQRIGRYKLLQLIGEGGCGAVYLAEQQEPVRRRVALKVIKLGMDTKSVIARFEAERQALALMDHPNIAQVLDAGATETGRPYFVMELVKGIPITRYSDEEGLTTEERLRLFIRVCHAVQHAHQKGIIHRDLKPSNILVADHDGVAVPKIIDFGIAKATSGQPLTEKTVFTALEQFIGTPAYMSPEQAKLSGLDIDTRSDVYSLGVLLYELLTGKTPFESKRLVALGLDEVRRIIQEELPTRPSTRLSTMAEGELTTTARQRHTEAVRLIHLVRGDLDWIVMKALEKDRARRYQTANGLAMDVERHLNSEAVVARPASAAYRLQRSVRRHKLAFAAGGAVLAALIIGLVVSTAFWIRAKRALHRAVAAEHDETVLRQQAQADAQRAGAAAKEASRTLAAFYFSEANRLIEANDGVEALAYLARILSADPANGAVLTRLATLITYHSWMIPSFSLKHEGWVVSAQFSPDGKRIVTASEDHAARVWDGQTGQPVTEPLGHGDSVNFAQFSPDGRRIVTASANGTARVWDAQTGEPLTGAMKHTSAVNTAQFSPDGQRVVTASSDHTARVWDARTGQALTGAIRHSAAVNMAQFSPDGRRILTASDDSTARIWDAQTGQALTEPLKHTNQVNTAQFSPDGQRVVTASKDTTARVWDAQTGQPLTDPLKHEDWVNSAQFSPDGRRVVSASMDHTARIWDAQTGRPLSSTLQHGRAVNAARFSPDGKRIITASSDDTARIWDAQSGRALVEPLQHPGAIWSAQFSPDGQRVITISADNTARVWITQTRPPLNEPLKHQGWVYSAQFSPDSKRVVTASYDHTARVWDAQTAQALTGTLKHTCRVHNAQFSPDGLRIVTVAQDSAAHEWDAKTGLALAEPLKHKEEVNCAQFSPDGQRIVTGSKDNTARIWDVKTGQALGEPFKHGGQVVSAQFSPDGTRIVTAAWDWIARVWDARTGELVAQSLKHGYPVNTAEFSPDGMRFVTASGDNTARVWDAQTGQPLTPPLKHEDYVLSAQFSPDGRRVVTSSRDNTARVWDAQTGQPLTEPLKHGQSVNFAQFSPDGRWVLTASDDSTARIWDGQSGQPLSDPFKHGGGLFLAEFSRDGKRVVTASHDYTARVWDVGLAPSRCPDWLLQLAEALGGNRLNARGLLEATTLDRAKTIGQIRETLKDQPDDGDGVMWGRWLLADCWTRTISPFSSLTVPQYIENRINENTPESLEEAEQLAGGNAELFRRVSEAPQVLASHGKLAESAARYREALRSNQGSWPDQPVKWEGSLNGLADVLRRQGKYDDAEQVFQQILTPSFVAQPQSATVLRDRGNFFARHGRWEEEAADFSRVIELDPSDDRAHNALAALLAQAGDSEGYRRYCAQVLARFGESTDGIIAGRVAKDCLIQAVGGVDLEAVGRLAETAAACADTPYSLLAKGWAEYRQGRWANAVEWMEQVLTTQRYPVGDAQAYLVLAMSQQRLEQPAKARAALAKGVGIIDQKLPKLESGDLGADWSNWIIAHALLEEAKALIEGQPAASKPPERPDTEPAPR